MNLFTVPVIIFLLIVFTQTKKVIPKDGIAKDRKLYDALNKSDWIDQSVHDEPGNAVFDEHNRRKRSPVAEPKPRPYIPSNPDRSRSSNSSKSGGELNKAESAVIISFALLLFIVCVTCSMGCYKGVFKHGGCGA